MELGCPPLSGAGIVSGMKSHPTSRVVLPDLGDKVLRASVEAVSATREDLERYTREFPDFVANHSQRCLANWIHDRLWHQLVARLDDQPHVRIVDKEPTREIIVDGTSHGQYRIRVKRHRGRKGAVATYPTRAAISFMHQLQLGIFDDRPIYHLIVGYEWDHHSHVIARPVLSLRDGIANVIWLEALDDEQAEAVAPLHQPVHAPSRPGFGEGTQTGVALSPEADGEHR